MTLEVSSQPRNGIIEDVVGVHGNNPYGLVCELDGTPDETTALSLYQAGTARSILRPVDHAYLSAYALHPGVRRIAYTNQKKHY